jgi:hypothetical protein
MPAPGFHRCSNAFNRPWENRDPQPFYEFADVRRGELRLAAEVGRALVVDQQVPPEARLKAALIFERMIRG